MLVKGSFKKLPALKATDSEAEVSALVMRHQGEEVLLAKILVKLLEDQLERKDFVRWYFRFHLLGSYPVSLPLCFETAPDVIERCDNFLHRLEALVP